jgi:dTDP-4-amino-4,6-dideoxy-D-glucose ammonia-lyase
VSTDLQSRDLRDRVLAALRRRPVQPFPPHDRTHPDEPARTAAELVTLAGMYVAEPFLTLEEARRRLGVDRARHATLLRAFTEVPELREAVLTGPTQKYWAKTVLPLEQSGSLDAVLRGVPRYPRMIGFYPGPTCMLRCGFCGRLTGVRYETPAIASGNETFAAIIDELPTDDPERLHISGGLEPLTNPGTGELVRRAAARGFNVTCYTNAFALTPGTLERQPGLWDLGALRVSLYGTDEQEYSGTTGRRGAFTRVRANLLDYQRLVRRRGYGPALGFNYVILPEQVHRITRLVDLIAELDEACPERPVAFLNLREEYSGRPGAGGLSTEDREELRGALGAFERRVRERAPGLRVDYGYALHALREGTAAVLPRLGHAELRPGAHPQVALQVDPLGNVFLYREAAFPGLPGADRYVAGRVSPTVGLGQVIEDFVASGRRIAAEPGDELFLDGFDQVVTARLRQLESDLAAGWGVARGLLR